MSIHIYTHAYIYTYIHSDPPEESLKAPQIQSSGASSATRLPLGNLEDFGDGWGWLHWFFEKQRGYNRDVVKIKLGWNRHITIHDGEYNDDMMGYVTTIDIWVC